MELIKYENLRGPSPLPISGNIHQLKAGSSHTILDSWCREFGPFFRFKLGPTKIIGVGDTETVRQVLQMRPHPFRRTARLQPIFEELGINGLFSSEGDSWLRMRRATMPGFKPNRLTNFHQVIERIAGNLYQKVQELQEEGTPTEIHKLFMRFTVDVTTELAFGYQMDTVLKYSDPLQSHLEVVLPTAYKRLLSIFPHWRYFKLAEDRKADASMNYIKDVIKEIINTSKKKLAEDPELRANPKTILESMLVAAEEETDAKLTDEEIVANSVTILIAARTPPPMHCLGLYIIYVPGQIYKLSYKLKQTHISMEKQ